MAAQLLARWSMVEYGLYKEDQNMTSGTPLGPDGLPGHDYFLDAVKHIDQAVTDKTIAISAAKGIVYSLVETLGTMVGDPDLPSHLKSGYMGALDLAVDLEAKITKLK